MSDGIKDNPENIGRRNVIKSLITLPVLGAMAYGVIKKNIHDENLRKNIIEELNISNEEPHAPIIAKNSGEKIRIGIIGYGGRGEDLIRAAGFAAPEWIDEMIEAKLKNPNDKRYEEYLNQEDLNIELTGICDVFQVRARKGLAASGNAAKQGKDGKPEKQGIVYKTYKELIARKDIDAVIIATPDHWHAEIAIEAAKAGKHVYVEKGMTRTVEETFALTEAVKQSGIIFQLGHQGRQTESYVKAREIIEKNILGKISLIEITTNRNDPNGAWQYNIHPEANEKTIDWEQFTGNGPQRPFSLERFFRWRCWWDYGTGLSGDLLTHEFDSINQILKLGIPESAVSSGGIYFYKDGREVPDVWQVALEYPKRDLTVLYSATLSNQRDRGKIIMGHDAVMEMGSNLTVYADPQSTRYKEKIDNHIIDPNIPIYTYIPGRKNVDAVTSATEAYFAGRGLLYTYRNGKRVDTTHLHIKEWLDCIREKKQPSCNIDEGFEEAITAHMATISYRAGAKVYWDADKKQVIIGEPNKSGLM